MDEEQIFQQMLEKVQNGYSIMEAGKALLMAGVDPAAVDTVLKRMQALEKQDPVSAQAEKELADLALRYDAWDQQRKWRNDRDRFTFKLGNMGNVGRSMSFFLSAPEAATELALSFVFGTGICAVAIYWFFIFQPSLPHPVNAPPYPMDCSLMPSGLPPEGCY